MTSPGADLSFDVMLREALVELQVELELRDERDRRRIRKAARRMHAAGILRARIPSIAAVAEAAQRAPGFGFAPAERPPPGPPVWHPEHRLNSEN
jgi:hypothetical protein